MPRCHFSERILKGFILSDDSLFELRQLLERRQKTRFSEGLSPEAKLAMQQMREDTKISFNEDSDGNSVGDEGQDDFSGRKSFRKAKKLTRKSGKDKSRRQISFTDSPRGNTKGQRIDTDPKNVTNKANLSGDSEYSKVGVKNRTGLTTDSLNVDEKCREWIDINGVRTTSGKW